MRILLVRPDGIGDQILCLPVATAVRQAWPSARIAFLSSEYAAPVLQHHPDLDEVLTVTGREALRELIRVFRRNFDVAIFLKPFRRLMLAAFLAGVPNRVATGYRWYSVLANRRVYEADITLSVARRLRDALKARGIDVLMTRTTDTLIALRDRGRMANDADATLFLSIHVNAANPRWTNPRSARGFETYFLSDAKTEDEQRVAEMENEADRFLDADTDPGDPLAFVLSDMVQNLYLRESSQLAETVQAGLKPVHPSGVDRGVKQAGFAVLVAAHRPAVLVEIGFGTNAAEATWLASARGQQSVADAIAESTRKYLADYSRRLGGAAIGGR